VLNAIHAFNVKGVQALQKGSTRPHTSARAFDAQALTRLREILHQSPRTFGKPTSLWTLSLLAEVSFEEGLTARRVSGEAVRLTLKRLGISWKRAKRWISSPDPAYARKKSARDRLLRVVQEHPDWVLGFQDETWWSRYEAPALNAWADADQPLCLVAQPVPQKEADPKALACYGLLVCCPADPAWAEDEVWLRFVDGRPVSAVTTPFLAWCCDKLAAANKRALLLVWDNAPWHVSKAVRAWIRAHNQQVKRCGQGVRIVACHLPSKSPWLNPLEPRWAHAKRHVVEPNGTLSAEALRQRVCDHFGCQQEPHLSVTEMVS
jgi:transposase